MFLILVVREDDNHEANEDLESSVQARRANESLEMTVMTGVFRARWVKSPACSVPIGLGFEWPRIIIIMETAWCSLLTIYNKGTCDPFGPRDVLGVGAWQHLLNSTGTKCGGSRTRKACTTRRARTLPFCHLKVLADARLFLGRAERALTGCRGAYNVFAESDFRRRDETR